MDIQTGLHQRNSRYVAHMMALCGAADSYNEAERERLARRHFQADLAVLRECAALLEPGGALHALLVERAGSLPDTAQADGYYGALEHLFSTGDAVQNAVLYRSAYRPIEALGGIPRFDAQGLHGLYEAYKGYARQIVAIADVMARNKRSFMDYVWVDVEAEGEGV